MIKLLHTDCMDYMKFMPDKFFELAIVDPPYGIGEGNKKNKTRSSYTGFGHKKTWVSAKDYGGGEWDFNIPHADYFKQLYRISQNQIVWGANYMVKYLDASMGWIIWDKDNGESDQSDCELAYSSFNKGARKFKHKWQGLLQENMKNKDHRIHPTQKPIRLYKWLLKNYAKQGDKIFDSHLGSGSIAIACHDMKFDMVGCEIDKEYYDGAVKRFENHKKQLSMF